MERLIIVVDCPDIWRENNWVDPARVRAEIEAALADHAHRMSVRVRWQTMGET